MERRRPFPGSSSNSQSPNPYQLLSAQTSSLENLNKLSIQSQSDSNVRFEALNKEMKYQSSQIASLKDVFRNQQELRGLLNTLRWITILANLIAGCWVMRYLMTMVITSFPSSASLWDYVLGNQYNMNTDAPGLIFIVISRYIVAFSLSFGIITAGLSVISSFNFFLTRGKFSLDMRLLGCYYLR